MVDGRKVREWRLVRLMNQRDLAERAELTQDAISEIEQGKRQPRVKTLAKIARALDVEPRELLKTERRGS